MAYLYGGPIDEVVPIGRRTEQLRLDGKVAIDEVRLLRAGTGFEIVALDESS